MQPYFPTKLTHKFSDLLVVSHDSTLYIQETFPDPNPYHFKIIICDGVRSEMV